MRDQSRVYRIRVAGRVGARVSGLLVPLEAIPSESEDVTVFTGRLDRHDLHRILSVVRDLGLELIDLETATLPS